MSEKDLERISNYQKVKGYQMTKPEITLVMQVKLKNPSYQNHLKSFMIEYSQDGKAKKQEVPLKNFIFH
ncbi:hypothetical protein [Piscibacillus salipiscarius]|nr:hypothetical protein [Piscibacillus salipiscarius]